MLLDLFLETLTPSTAVKSILSELLFSGPDWDTICHTFVLDSSGRDDVFMARFRKAGATLSYNLRLQYSTLSQKSR